MSKILNGRGFAAKAATGLMITAFILSGFFVPQSKVLAIPPPPDPFSVTAATGGTNISPDKAVNGSAPAFTTLGDITITESSSKDEFAPSQASTTLILTAPSGWQFNPGAGSVAYTQDPATGDFLGVTINVSSSTITVTLSTDTPANKQDTLTISGIQVQALDKNTAPTTGNILRTSGNPGTATVTGIVNDSTNFGSLSQSAPLIIPVITWPTPADITYGTPLGPDQLNATTTVDGTFVYIPPAGTILDAGASQTLEADFTPTASSTYANTSTTVAINVLKADQTITFGPLSDKQVSDPDFTVSATTTSGLAITFTASGTCSMADPTTVHIVSAGTCSITASQAGNSNYNAAADVTQSFVIASSLHTITASSGPNGSISPSGTVMVADGGDKTFNFIPDPGYHPDNLTVDGTSTAATSSSYTFYSVTADHTIDITFASNTTPIITWATPADIAFGTPLGPDQLNATTTVDGTFTYIPPAGTVLSIGSHLLEADFTPTASSTYNNASTTVTINVTSAAITITPPSGPLPNSAVNVPYSTTINATSTDPADVLTWSASGLPGWLTFATSTNGLSATLTGTPTSTATSTFSIHVAGTDPNSSSTVDYTLQTLSALITITPPSGPLPTSTVGTAYSTTINATSTNPADVLTWSASGLPGWLTFATSTNGLSATLTGTPTSTATSTFSIHVAGIDPNVSSTVDYVLRTVPAPPAPPSGGGGAVILNVGGGGTVTVPATPGTTGTAGITGGSGIQSFTPGIGGVGRGNEPGGQVLGAAAFRFTTDLGFGMRNSDVGELQNRLTGEGVYSGPITQYFGALTRAAVRAYQAKFGISRTGFVGPLTRAQLNSTGQAATTTGGSSTASLMAAIQAQIAALQARIAALR